eukprot:4988736-Prorocentrum_lima.AAC.1
MGAPVRVIEGRSRMTALYGSSAGLGYSGNTGFHDAMAGPNIGVAVRGTHGPRTVGSPARP